MRRPRNTMRGLFLVTAAVLFIGQPTVASAANPEPKVTEDDLRALSGLGADAALEDVLAEMATWQANKESFEAEGEWTTSGAHDPVLATAPNNLLNIDLLAAAGCVYTLNAAAVYQRSFWDVRSFQEARSSFYASDACKAGILRIRSCATVRDFGVVVASNVWQASECSGWQSPYDGSARATAQQIVNVYSWPSDYHGWGSDIHYTYRGEIHYHDGRRSALCVDASYTHGVHDAPAFGAAYWC